MLANILAALGSLFNLFTDTVYKLFVWLFVILLCVIAMGLGFVTFITWLVTQWT